MLKLKSFKNSIEKFQKEHELLLTRLNLSDVRGILKKGFSLIFSGNQKVKKVENLKENSKITIAVSDGIIECEVKNITKIKSIWYKIEGVNIVKKSNVSFESTLEKLEKIVERLESGEESLEDSIALYEEGINISNYCKDMLKNAKQRVEKVNLK